MRRTVLSLIACCLLATLLPGCSRRAPESVFLIVVDTLRPDRLSCYGRKVYQTPHIDSLAAAGVRFTRAQSVASWAVPSMGAMMTSLYPTQLGLVERPAGELEIFGRRELRDQLSYTLAPEERTLAEMMRDAGYTTAAFVNQPALNANDGFAQGFDDYFYPTGIDEFSRLESSAPRDVGDGGPLFESAREVDVRLIDTFASWLTRNSDRSVFVWIHLLTPHHPYRAPPWTERRSSATANAMPSSSDAYDGEVIAADELVGEIVNLIDEHVGAERSAVILASDNGEEFGEHGNERHGNALVSQQTWVPLIVRDQRAPAGQTVGTIVRTTDILPTILELSGSTPQLPEGTHGKSLVPLFESDGAHRTVYAEAMLYGGTRRALMVDGSKIIYDEDNERYQLFDYLYDPAESVDLVQPRSSLADSLRFALELMYRELSDDYARRAEGRTASDDDAARFMRALSLDEE